MCGRVVVTLWKNYNSPNFIINVCKSRLHTVPEKPFHISNFEVFFFFSFIQLTQRAGYRSGIITCAAEGATIFHWLLRKNLNDRGLFRAFGERQSIFRQRRVGIHVCVCVRGHAVKWASLCAGLALKALLPNSSASPQVRRPVALVNQHDGTVAKPLSRDKPWPGLKLN